MSDKFICAHCRKEFDRKDITLCENKYYCLYCIEHNVSFANKSVSLRFEKRSEKEKEELKSLNLK